MYRARLAGPAPRAAGWGAPPARTATTSAWRCARRHRGAGRGDQARGPGPLHFTSGTTGLPKAALHVHEAVVAHHATASWAPDLRPGDDFWCTADPGWVTGTSCGIIAPLTHGATLLSYAGEFEASRWYQLLADHRVTVWYTAPTALRMLERYGMHLLRSYDLRRLRHIASVGEPLNPDLVA